MKTLTSFIVLLVLVLAVSVQAAPNPVTLAAAGMGATPTAARATITGTVIENVSGTRIMPSGGVLVLVHIGYLTIQPDNAGRDQYRVLYAWIDDDVVRGWADVYAGQHVTVTGQLSIEQATGKLLVAASTITVR